LADKRRQEAHQTIAMNQPRTFARTSDGDAMSIHSTSASDWEEARVSTRSARGPPNDDQVLSLREFAALAGISIATLRRLIKEERGPAVTWLSTRRCGIRLKHGRSWLDSRTVAPQAA